MTIRTALADEYETLTVIWEASVRASHHFLQEEDIVGLRPQILQLWLPAVSVFVHVAVDGKPDGFIGIADHKIEMLFILPESQGKGVGKALLQYAVKQLAVTEVDVNEQNPQALGFYQYLGFEIYGRSPLDGQGKPFPLLHMKLAGTVTGQH